MRILPRFEYRAWAVLLAVWIISGCSALRPAGPVGLRPEAHRAESPWGSLARSDSVLREPSRLEDLFPPQSDARGTRRLEDDFSVSHPRVNDFVGKFQTRLRGHFQGVLERSGKYLPRMTAILQEEGVPPELAYLPIIESGFRTGAVSPKGAVGPWQFISGTGKRYGLRIDSYVDERRDPVKSTRAAARYLRDLHDMFGCWHLSLAAYNTGEERIARIIDRRGTLSYWDMMERGYLHPETRDFVPQFLAAVQIARSPEEHGFYETDEPPMTYDTFPVNRSLSFRTMAKMAGVSESEIAELNPALVRRMTPPDRQGYRVHLPKGTRDRFALAYNDMLRTASFSPARAAAKTPTVYRVRRGDTPAGIASRFGVSVQSLRKVNSWRAAHKLKPGERVRIPQKKALPVALVEASQRPG